eukprot:Hpha_TRINITY_DN8107_c0_g2::TRINITY_DN8107_c0_g2_i1::g.172177::m.172177
MNRHEILGVAAYLEGAQRCGTLSGSVVETARDICAVLRKATGRRKVMPDMHQARSGATLCPLQGGLLVAGGNTRETGRSQRLTSAEFFDVAAGTWTPVADLDTPRFHAVGASVHGKACVLGGDTMKEYLDSGQWWEPGADMWRPLPELPTPSRGGAGVAARGGESMMIAGGHDGESDTAAGR